MDAINPNCWTDSRPAVRMESGRLGGSVAPHRLPGVSFWKASQRRSALAAVETISNLIFSGPLAWTSDASCRGRTELCCAPAGERPEARVGGEGQAGAVAPSCPAPRDCRDGARGNREDGFWGGESEEERAAAGFRVDMRVGRVARYPKGAGRPVRPRAPRVA